MEEHPDEAFRVNVLGTLNVARAAKTYETGTFVLISTDKAVRPTSIMGATKRIAELMVLALGPRERTDDVRRRALRQRHGQPRLGRRRPSCARSNAAAR